MFSELSYLKMKKALLKNFRNTTVYIEAKGTFSTRYWIDKSKILINRHKVVISNEHIDCTILLDFIKKVKIDDGLRIELISVDSKYILDI